MKLKQVAKLMYTVSRIFKSSLKITEKFIYALPKFIWTAGAVFGIFVFGALVGQENTITEKEYEDLEKQHKEYQKVIKGYETLNKYYVLQGQDIEIMMDTDILYNHPEEVNDALKSIESLRDRIILQQGRVMELRNHALLPPEDFYFTNLEDKTEQL